MKNKLLIFIGIESGVVVTVNQTVLNTFVECQNEIGLSVHLTFLSFRLFRVSTSYVTRQRSSQHLVYVCAFFILPYIHSDKQAHQFLFIRYTKFKKKGTKRISNFGISSKLFDQIVKYLNKMFDFTIDHDCKFAY